MTTKGMGFGGMEEKNSQRGTSVLKECQHLNVECVGIESGVAWFKCLDCDADLEKDIWADEPCFKDS